VELDLESCKSKLAVPASRRATNSHRECPIQDEAAKSIPDRGPWSAHQGPYKRGHYFRRILPDMAAATAELNRAQALQREIWAQAVAGCQETGSPAVMTLVLDSVNEMIDIAATRTGGLADASADNNSRNAGTAGACFIISG
jgi:hypothetical protein